MDWYSSYKHEEFSGAYLTDTNWCVSIESARPALEVVSLVPCNIGSPYRNSIQGINPHFIPVRRIRNF